MPLLGFTQDDLLKSIDSNSNERAPVTGAFKSSRVINGHSMEMIGAGVLDFRILHRFGTVKQGFKNMFGLDEARMRMGFDLGLTKNLSVGIGRSTLNKELDGFVKYRVLQQTEGNGEIPLSIILVAGSSIHTLENLNPNRKLEFSSRLGYFYQLIAGRKFSEGFSLQLSPTLVHRNLVDEKDDNDTYAVGIGARQKLSKRVALVLDYFYIVNGLPSSDLHNPLSVGIDIETGGHVFQLHFSNATGMNEKAFITGTSENWGNGEIRFGFNLSRVFTLKKQKETEKW